MSKKSRIVKRILTIATAVIVVFISAVLIIPYAFKDRIKEAVINEVNKNLDARVDFEDIRVGLIYSFPNLNLQIKGLGITGINEFDKDTLAYIPLINAVVDIMSVVRGDVYEVKRIGIEDPLVKLKLAGSGNTNWDIVPSGGEESQEVTTADEAASSFTVALRHLKINNASIYYDDELSNMRIVLQNFDHQLSGDLTADRTNLATQTAIGSATFNQDGINYLNNAKVDFDAGINADLQNEVYSFEKNQLKINELLLQFEGSVAMEEGNPQISLTFEAPQNTFRNFLSLVPVIYARDFNEIKTSGTLALSGFIKGKYTSNSLPSFNLNVEVDNAEFRYPDLPSSVDDINLKLIVSNPGGSEDNTVIDIREMHLSMIESPFDLKAIIKNLISDPYIDASLVTRLELANISKVYPLEEKESVQGVLDADVKIRGRQSSFENSQYDKCEVNGSLVLKDFEYSMEGYDNEFRIKNAKMNFTPAYLDLLNLDFIYAESDMVLKGKIENYIPYYISDGLLRGRFTATSNIFNVDQFVSSSEEEAPGMAPQNEEELTAFRVPVNLDMEISAAFRELVYDSLSIRNIQGKISVRDEKVIMSKLEGGIFGGIVDLSGTYNTYNTDTPLVDMRLKVSRISYKDAFRGFGIIQKYAPMIEHAIGEFSADLSFSTKLDVEMMPVWETFNGNGLLNSNTVRLENVNTLNLISETLKSDLFRTLTVDPLKILFDFQDGKLIVRPVDMKVGGMKAGLSGWTGLDQSIGYEFNIQLPRSIMGDNANKIIDGLISQANASGASFKAGETIPLDVLISGSLTKPVIKPVIGKTSGNILEDLNKGLKEELDKKKEEMEKQAKEEARKIIDAAEKQAQEIMNEARKKADQVRSLAREGAQKIKKEADAHTEKLIAEGKKKGPLAEIAAKKAADEYKKKAYNEADKGVAEADKQADNIIKEAQKKADKVRADAQKKVDSM